MYKVVNVFRDEQQAVLVGRFSATIKYNRKWALDTTRGGWVSERAATMTLPAGADIEEGDKVAIPGDEYQKIPDEIMNVSSVGAKWPKTEVSLVGAR